MCMYNFEYNTNKLKDSSVSSLCDVDNLQSSGSTMISSLSSNSLDSSTTELAEEDNAISHQNPLQQNNSSIIATTTETITTTTSRGSPNNTNVFSVIFFFIYNLKMVLFIHMNRIIYRLC